MPRHAAHGSTATNPVFAAVTRDDKPVPAGSGTNAGSPDERSTSGSAHSSQGAAVAPASLRVWKASRPPPPVTRTIVIQHVTTSAATAVARVARSPIACHAYAAGIASGRSTGTKKRAGAAHPAHHIANDVTASSYGMATISHSSARRRARVNPANANSRAGAVASRPKP